MTEELSSKLCPDCRKVLSEWLTETSRDVSRIQTILACALKLSAAMGEFRRTIEEARRQIEEARAKEVAIEW